MVNPADGAPRKPRRLWLPLLLLMVLAIFMYVSIMYKIIHYGP